MKKLALGLLLVLGAANVNAASKQLSDAQLKRVVIDTDDLAEAATAEAKGLIAKNPRLAAAVIGAAVTYIVYAFNHWVGDKDAVVAVAAVMEGETVKTPAVEAKAAVSGDGFGKNLSRPASEAWNMVKGFCVQNGRVPGNALGLGAGLLAALITYDLAQPDSKILEVLASLQKQEAAATEVVAA